MCPLNIYKIYHKENLNKFQDMEIKQTMLSHHNTVKQRVNYGISKQNPWPLGH